MTISASQFPAVYDSLGISISDLGCIMLDLNPVKLEVDDQEDLYYSPYQEFVQGTVADHKAHATLLFGLLSPGSQIKPLVDAVLESWKKPSAVKVDHLEVFPGKEDDGTEYSCIVAVLDATDLVEANSRLRLLPHIDTFPEYKPHMTLAYVKPEATTEFLENFAHLVGSQIATSNINYGK
jgi:2'-5' RNA ligase